MKWFLLLVPTAVLGAHFWIVSGPAPQTPSGLARYDFSAQQPLRLASYFNAGDYWLGFSYALATAFAAWCFLRVLYLRRQALASSAAGLTLSGVLVAGVCFLTGCCGSPMLPLYLGLFGTQFLSVTKPLTFCITVLSILIGYAWMLKRAPIAIKNNVHDRIHETPGANSGQV